MNFLPILQFALFFTFFVSGCLYLAQPEETYIPDQEKPWWKRGHIRTATISIISIILFFVSCNL